MFLFCAELIPRERNVRDRTYLMCLVFQAVAEVDMFARGDQKKQNRMCIVGHNTFFM